MEFYGGCGEMKHRINLIVIFIDDRIDISRAIVNKVIVRYLMICSLCEAIIFFEE